MSTLGERIRYLREQKKLSMQQLADEINTYKGNISKYEKGINDPSIPTLIALSTYFQVSLNWILVGEELRVSNQEDICMGPAERELLHEFRALSVNAQNEVIAFTKLKANFDFMATTSSTSRSGDASTTDEMVG